MTFLAVDQHVGLRLKFQVIQAEADQFGDAYCSGVAQVQHGTVTDAAPPSWVGRVQNGLCFFGRQMPDQTRLGFLDGNRQDTPELLHR